MSIKRNDSISMIGKGIRNSSIIGLGNKGSSTFVTQNLSIIRMGMGRFCVCECYLCMLSM